MPLRGHGGALALRGCGNIQRKEFDGFTHQLRHLPAAKACPIAREVALHALQHVQLVQQLDVMMKGRVEPATIGQRWLEQQGCVGADVLHEEYVNFPLRSYTATRVRC
jgi:hypothetical protein